MFNIKRLKAIQAQNESLKEKNESLEYEIVKLSRMSAENKNLLLNIKEKVAPGEVKQIVIVLDAIEFAKSLQKFPKQKMCGRGGCGSYYMIPVSEIDKVATMSKEEIEARKESDIAADRIRNTLSK
jgi:hypothetical protein